MTKSQRKPNAECRRGRKESLIVSGRDARACHRAGAASGRASRLVLARCSRKEITDSLRRLLQQSVSSLMTRHSSFIFAAPAILLLLAGCRREMYDQPSSRPLEYSAFFRDNQMASRPLPAHTVARGQLNDDDAFYRGKIGTNLVTVFPMPVTRELIERGRERFNIYCAVCHDRTGEGNGMIVQRGFPRPPSYHIDRLREAPIGHFYDVITQGYGIMYSYADRVEPADRWAIAAYIRVLQASRNVRIADLAPAERSRLEGAK